ncbi:hypothetical protein [Anaerorhabdus sp.]|uniref:hypothetical protein n=1 Tax=Anaerorhabdus sp. TaxID=1872524 RepID=UPI002B203DC2|nr:hypothetical protein [Anaerorhabdus sp.]MEA4874394.1 hypothetical protein [Anaerorhabdus sp.]
MKIKHGKVHSAFYTQMVRLFLVLVAIGSFCLGLLWIGLSFYESVTPNGALNHYVQLVKNGDFEEIYDESKKVYSQFNTKDEYIAYLEEFYSNVDLSKAAFTKKSYDEGDYQYYDMTVDGQTITTLELKKDSNKNKWNVRTLTEARSFRIDTQLNDLQMTINDTPIEKDRIKETDIPATAYKNLNNPELAPIVNQYYLDNMIEVPTIEVSNPNYIIVKDALIDYFYAGTKPSNEEMEEYTTLIEKVARTYCMYITEDETFANLRKLLYTKTSFYDAIRSFNNGFFSSHDRIEFSDMNVFDVVEIGEDALIGSVSFDYVVYIGERSQTYSNTYQLTFLKVDGKWLLTNLVIDDTH